MTANCPKQALPIVALCLLLCAALSNGAQCNYTRSAYEMCRGHSACEHAFYMPENDHDYAAFDYIHARHMRDLAVGAEDARCWFCGECDGETREPNDQAVLLWMKVVTERRLCSDPNQCFVRDTGCVCRPDKLCRASSASGSERSRASYVGGADMAFVPFRSQLLVLTLIVVTVAIGAFVVLRLRSAESALVYSANAVLQAVGSSRGSSAAGKGSAPSSVSRR